MGTRDYKTDMTKAELMAKLESIGLRRNSVGDYPLMSFEEIMRQAKGLVYGLGITVVVAMAGDLADIASFEQVSLAGLGLTAVRSGASFVVSFFTKMNEGGK